MLGAVGNLLLPPVRAEQPTAIAGLAEHAPTRDRVNHEHVRALAPELLAAVIELIVRLCSEPDDGCPGLTCIAHLHERLEDVRVLSQLDDRQGLVGLALL